MQRNAFGHPQPVTAAEIRQALGELDLLACDAAADLFAPIENVTNGWCAEIAHADTGDGRFSTLAFPSKLALEVALAEVGITLITEPF